MVTENGRYDDRWHHLTSVAMGAQGKAYIYMNSCGTAMPSHVPNAARFFSREEEPYSGY